MKKYELLYIVSSEYTDEEIKKIQADVAGLLEKVGAKISRDEALQKIRLAYPIKKRTHGTYILVHFEGDAEKLTELDHLLRLKDEVLRHMVVDLPVGAADKKFELTSYIAPLSEEAFEQKSRSREDRPRTPAPAPAPAAPTAVQEATPTAPVDAETAKMSMAELDKKLDEILDEDVK